ncbi:MAG: hypothetical protein LC115_08850 [Bacteroidia bacterium]|nr:hypothetical protein [Bacteroidia bacterium]
MRGLSVTDNYFYIGGSDICFDGFKRFSSNPSIYILDKQRAKPIEIYTFSGLGDMYEIRQLDDVDFSLSDSKNK